MRPLLLALGLLVSGSSAQGQLGITFCSPQTDSANSYIHVSVLTSPALQEIIVHEAAHRAQVKRLGCGEMMRRFNIVTEGLALEVEAYCASMPEAEKRGVPRETVRWDYAQRMGSQFNVPRTVPYSLLHVACP